MVAIQLKTTTDGKDQFEEETVLIKTVLEVVIGFPTESSCPISIKDIKELVFPIGSKILSLISASTTQQICIRSLSFLEDVRSRA